MGGGASVKDSLEDTRLLLCGGGVGGREGGKGEGGEERKAGEGGGLKFVFVLVPEQSLRHLKRGCLVSKLIFLIRRKRRNIITETPFP